LTLILDISNKTSSCIKYIVGNNLGATIGKSNAVFSIGSIPVAVFIVSVLGRSVVFISLNSIGKIICWGSVLVDWSCSIGWSWSRSISRSWSRGVSWDWSWGWSRGISRCWAIGYWWWWRCRAVRSRGGPYNRNRSSWNWHSNRYGSISSNFKRFVHKRRVRFLAISHGNCHNACKGNESLKKN
jgi:hypothetical protein